MKAIGTQLALQAALVLIFLGFVLPVCMFLNTPAAAQNQRPAHKAAAPAKSTTRAKPASTAPARFSAAGLNNEDDLVRIYSGDFQSVSFDRSGNEFMQIISGYMNDYARECKQFLPPDKVEITQQVCTVTGDPVPNFDSNGNVVPTPSSSSCQTVGTGLFADPQLYAAVNRVAVKSTVSIVGNMLGMVTGKGSHASNPFSISQQMLDQLVAEGTEMETVIGTNGCGSPGLRNFQSNLIRFANGNAPIKFAGAVVPTVIPGDPAKDTDFGRLLDDLVADNARAWMLNRYRRGSISDPIVEHDPLGHPTRVFARYSYADARGTQQPGHVTVSFKDGAPDCVYFSDAPDTCRVATQRIISAYRKNQYAAGTNAADAQSNQRAPADLDAAEAQLQHAREQHAARVQRDKQILAADAAGNPAAKAPAQMVRREEEDNRQRWAGTRQSPAAYSPQWRGQNLVIVGTVSRVEVDPNGSPQWVTIYFKESPDATFVVCSPYPDMFQERVGLNLSALVGKTLEAAGQVESPYCGGNAPKGSIRVVESTQWKVY